jgi:sec-independent protein translocase protein TatB
MLSIPHMIVVFVVVLVVFGPQKLPELARGLGKLMAEFRKASTDFKSAFEEEMRDLERQAREVERKKQALLASAAASASSTVQQPATSETPSESETQAPAGELAAASNDHSSEETRSAHAEVLTPTPVAESVARSSESADATVDSSGTSAAPSSETGNGNAPARLDPTHDHQQPA